MRVALVLGLGVTALALGAGGARWVRVDAATREGTLEREAWRDRA